LSILTAVPEEVGKLLRAKPLTGKVEVYSCDVTAIKTAARAIPVLYRMNGSKVEEKWSGASASSWH